MADGDPADAPDPDAGDGTDTAPDAGDSADTADVTGLPADAIDRAERLTRLARSAVDDSEAAAYRRERDALLADRGYAARVREDGTGATLVLYPEEWLEDGVVDVERVEDTDRAVERSLSGAGSGDDWAAVETHNRAVAERVRERHGAVHGETAHAFADFMSNHYAKRVERATPGERAEFRDEYLPRNAWPSEAQLERLERSLELVVDAAESI